MGGVAGRGHRQALPAQPVGGVGLHSGVDAGENGYAQEHAGHAPQSAAHQDGHHDPEPGDARAVPQDLGAQDVAVKCWSRPPPR